MNCKETENNFDNYLDGDLFFNEQKSMDLHLSSCTRCEQRFEEIKSQRKALSMLPVVEPSEDFEETVFAAVRKQYPLKGGNRFAIGFASALVASFLIWFINGAYLTQFNTQQSPMINLAMNQNHIVRLMLDSPTDIGQVTLSLGLPENIRLKGYESQQQLVWQTSLTKGNNILTLPVTAVSKGRGDLVAQVQYGNRTKEFHLVFKTVKNIQGDGANNYQIKHLHSNYNI